MPDFVALLRGVNVGGKVAKMDAVRASFEALGLANVRTYVQSGNVLFATKAGTDASLAKKIAMRLEKDIGFPIAVLVLSAKDLAQVVAHNPFLKEKGIDPAKLHVTFLHGAPPAPGLQKMAAIASGRDRFVARGTTIYLHCPDGYGRSKLVNNAFERALKVGATTRNWNSVTTLAGMLKAPSAGG
ncbi:MAG TPA: DUF1697 domain-containing protein [Polyangia bacterium]|nr:DUF1697 domain-containing protein [Polyangia bacterium]